MAQSRSATAKAADKEDTPDVIPADNAQIVPVGSMDVDPNTGAEVRVGIPETDDDQDVAEFILWLAEQSDSDNVDEMDMLKSILRTANTAETLAEALREKTTVNGRDHVDRPFMCTGFQIREGKFEDETLPYYASMEAIDPDHPEGFVINCGGMKPLVHLRTLQRFNAFPLPMKITGKTTRKGRTVLSFEILQQNNG